MGYNKIKYFDGKIAHVKVRLKPTKSETQLIKFHIQKGREVYIRYCSEQIRRICNGVPMVYPNEWCRDKNNGCDTLGVSIRCIRKMLEYGFDLLVRAQFMIKDNHTNPTMNQAYKILKNLKRKNFEYDPDRNEFIIPKQSGMENNLFNRHEIHIPKVGKIRVVKKDINHIPKNTKIKMIRIHYSDFEIFATITYADNSKQEFDENGFMKLIKKGH